MRASPGIERVYVLPTARAIDFLAAAGFGLVNIVRNILAPLQILAPLGLDLALLKYIGREDRDVESTHRILRRPGCHRRASVCGKSGGG